MKLRVVDTEMALELMERYLLPVIRSSDGSKHFVVELDEVVSLLLEAVEKWTWKIDPTKLAVEIGKLFEPQLMRVEISEWSADDFTGYSIAISQVEVKRRVAYAEASC